MEEITDAVNQINRVGPLIVGGLLVLIFGTLAVFTLHVLGGRLVYPLLATRGQRLFTVAFATLYVLVLVASALMLLRRLGYDTSVLAPVAFAIVLGASVLFFFLVPYLPRLPFMRGNMVELVGVMGIVDRVTPMYTNVRTFDGRVVFVPHTLLAASRIVNYHTLPKRRIELEVKATLDSDLDRCRELLLEVMKGDSRVLEEPAPSVLATNADAAGIEMVGWCWVKNDDWFPARSDLWFRVIDAFGKDEGVALSVARHEVLLSGRANEGS